MQKTLSSDGWPASFKNDSESQRLRISKEDLMNKGLRREIPFLFNWGVVMTE